MSEWCGTEYWKQWKEEKKKTKELQTWLFCEERVPFRSEGEIKSFIDKQNIQKFNTTKLAVYKKLKGII